MLHLRCACLLVALSLLVCARANANTPENTHKDTAAKLPVTTTSVEARKRFQLEAQAAAGDH